MFTSKPMAQKIRSLIEDSITSEFAWFNMHGQGAQIGKLYERKAKSGYDGTDVSGTTTGVWTDREGWFTPDPTAGNGATVSAANCNDLFALNTLTDGGVLVVCALNVGANAGSGEEYPWWYGAINAEIALVLSYGGNINVKVYMRNDGGALNQSSSHNMTGDVGNDIIIGCYFDVTNSLMTVYVNESTASKTMIFPTDGTALVGTETISNDGLGITGRSDKSATTLLGQAGTGSATTMRDFFAIRFTDDQSANIPAIMQGFLDAHTELPWGLEDA